MTYDDSVYDVTVTVTDEENGILKTEAVYSKDGKETEEALFENAYNEPPVPDEKDPKKVDKPKTKLIKPEPAKKPAKGGKTFDASRPVLWFGIMAAAVIIAAAAMIRIRTVRRRSRRK